mmetsp:Transcript_120978/g.386468  ORF Transcript_120978/g.386468 Transcript_120978/m.386468 type:complete len:338 (+) Transcript_120978:96-1109(+)
MASSSELVHQGVKIKIFRLASGRAPGGRREGRPGVASARRILPERGLQTVQQIFARFLGCWRQDGSSRDRRCRSGGGLGGRRRRGRWRGRRGLRSSSGFGGSCGTTCCRSGSRTLRLRFGPRGGSWRGDFRVCADPDLIALLVDIPQSPLRILLPSLLVNLQMPSLAELAREARVQREHLCKGHVAWLDGTSRGCGRCCCRRRCPRGGGEHDLEALIIDVLQSGYRVGLPGLRVDVDVACFLEPRRELRIRIYHILKRHLLGIRGHAVRRRRLPRLLRRRGLFRLLRLLRGFLLRLIRLRRGLFHLRVPRRNGRSRIRLLRNVRAGLEVRLLGVRRE